MPGKIGDLLKLTCTLPAFRRREWADPGSYRSLVETRLRRVVQVAARRVPHYRDLFHRTGLDPDDIRSPEDLVKVPITTNEVLRALPRKMVVAEGHPFEGLVDRYSSGSTGITLHTYLTPRERYLQALNAMRVFRSGGYRARDILLDLTEPFIPPPRWIERLKLFRKKYIPHTEDIREQIEKMLAWGPEVILTLPTILDLLLDAVVEHSAVLGAVFRPRLVYTVGEHLSERLRKRSMEVLGCDPIDVYGATEVGPIAFQCPERDGYHINADGLVVEVVDAEGRPLPPGETGRVLVTGLQNETMPFVRYSVGDLGRLRGGRCRCGRGLPLMESVQGRIVEALFRSDGKSISAYGPIMVMETGQGVDRYQLLQDRPGALVVRFVGTLDNRGDIVSGLKKFLGDDLHVEFEEVDSLGTVGGGKFKLVLSRCHSPEELDG
jgi:phenylacetate-coenzyme A ligase PaaK-like adenylate-forming protein